jgi:hypothetical protein
VTRAASEEMSDSEKQQHVDELLQSAIDQLSPLRSRLEESVRKECDKSPCGKAFVKLSTRSPKDAKSILKVAEGRLKERVAAVRLDPSAGGGLVDDNTKWIMLSEEVRGNCYNRIIVCLLCDWCQHCFQNNLICFQ